MERVRTHRVFTPAEVTRTGFKHQEEFTERTCTRREIYAEDYINGERKVLDGKIVLDQTESSSALKPISQTQIIKTRSSLIVKKCSQYKKMQHFHKTRISCRCK